jgi:hypothetical protein
LAVAEPAAPPPAQSLPDSVDDAVELARRHNFDALLVGLLVEHMGGLDDGATKAGIFAALVTRARQN